MDDTIGAPIFFPQEQDIQVLRSMARSVLSEEFGDGFVAEKVMDRLHALIETPLDKPIVLLKKAGDDTFALGIFWPGASEPEISFLPPPPAGFSEADIQQALTALLHAVSNDIGGHVDWPLCQVLCGFGGDNPLDVLAED